MDYLVHQLLTPGESLELLGSLLKEDNQWHDGKATSGAYASKVKNNLQLDRSSSLSISSADYIVKKITLDPLLKSFSLPRKVHGVMFSRTGKGQGYGMHVDNAYMSTGRSDISFTIFLSKANDYEGGELCIQNLQENKEIKLKQGQIILYPSTSLHSVNPVTLGERVACVGWIHSYVASEDDRKLLFGLDAGAKGLLAKNGQSPELDLIFQAYNNLLRRLGR